MPEAPVLLKDAVPEEYRGAGYLKDLLDKPWEEARPLLFKKLDNAEKLVGKKTGVPAPDAPEEEWEKHFTSLKPASADDYKMPVKEGAKSDPLFLKAVQQALHDGSIHPKQAAKFVARFSKEMEVYSAAQEKARKDQEVKDAAAFDELAKSALGEQNKEVMARTKAAIIEHAPPTLKAYVDKLDDKSLVIMSGVIDAIMKKYMSEDDLKPGGRTGGDGGASKRAEAQKLLAEVSKMTGFEADYEQKRAALRKIYEEADAEAKAGK